MKGHRSSTGLDKNVAAALAYLAGPLSGVLLLIVERSSRYVRFHAMQSVVALGGLWLLAALLVLLAVLTVFVSATGFQVLLYSAWITGGVWIVVWIICLVNAFSGRMGKLPIAGTFAERWSVPSTTPPSSSVP
jgi:uncharacterized membrane protein